MNDDVNEEWASDKTRFAVDGLARRRLDRPYVRVDGKLRAVTWDGGVRRDRGGLAGLTGKRCGGAGDLSMSRTWSREGPVDTLGSDTDRGRRRRRGYDGRAGELLFNSTIAGIETRGRDAAGRANPRWEAPLVNTRLRKAVKRARKCSAIGDPVDLTYPVDVAWRRMGLLGGLPKAVADVFAQGQARRW